MAYHHARGRKTGRREIPLPVVCITTTAGTGSEADQWGVVNSEETQEKIGCGVFPCRPFRRAEGQARKGWWSQWQKQIGEQRKNRLCATG